MTEHRPSYDAFNSTAKAPPSHAVTDASPLEQCYADGSISHDTVLFLPVLVSSVAWETHCLHYVHLSDGVLGVCNVKTDQYCAGCGCPMCEKHRSSYSITIPDVHDREKQRALLCEICSHLPLQSILALREFRRLINEQGQVEP